MKPNLTFWFCLIIFIYFKYWISFIIIKSKYKLCLSREGGTQDEEIRKSLLLRKERNYRENYKELKRTSSWWYRIRWTPFFCDESASPWRWVRRLLPLVAMGVGVRLQPGSLVIFSGAAALDPHSAIIFLGLLSVSAMMVSRWPYLFLIAVPWPWLGSRQPCSLFPRAKEN